MLTAEAHIETDRPSRYLIQLCEHASDMSGQHGHTMLARHRGSAMRQAEMRHAEWTDSYGIVRMNWGECRLRAAPGTLTLTLHPDSTVPAVTIPLMTTTKLRTEPPEFTVTALMTDAT